MSASKRGIATGNATMRRRYEHKFTVRPFAWRSTNTIEFIKLLDKAIHNNKSAQFKRQMKEVVTGHFQQGRE